MKKILPLEVLFVLLLAGVMALLLWKKEPDDLPLTDLEQAVLSSCTLTGMEKAGDMRLKRAFGLNAADYDSCLKPWKACWTAIMRRTIRCPSTNSWS